MGTLQPGRIANFIITSGNLFSADNVIYENWIRGKQYVVNNRNVADLRGSYNLTLTPTAGGNSRNLKLNISGNNPEKPEYQIVVSDTVKLTPKVAIDNNVVSMQVALDRRQPGSLTRLTGYRDQTSFRGDGELPDGKLVTWTAVRTGDAPASM